MNTDTISLFDEILSSAMPRMPVSFNPSESERESLRQDVEQTVRISVRNLEKGESRSAFEVDKTSKDAIYAKISIQMEGNPLKAKIAKGYVKNLFKDWELLVRSSEAFSLLKHETKNLVNGK